MTEQRPDGYLSPQSPPESATAAPGQIEQGPQKKTGTGVKAAIAGLAVLALGGGLAIADPLDMRKDNASAKGAAAVLPADVLGFSEVNFNPELSQTLIGKLVVSQGGAVMIEQRTARERAELVAEYLVLPQGSKGRWLDEHGVSQRRMQSWRRQYLYGDLELGLEPRDTARMSATDGAEFARLKAQLAIERQAREEEARQAREQIESLTRANDALGKAIGLLQQLSVRQGPTNGE